MSVIKAQEKPAIYIVAIANRLVQVSFCWKSQQIFGINPCALHIPKPTQIKFDNKRVLFRY